MIILENKEATVRLIVKSDAYTLTKEDACYLFDRFYMANLENGAIVHRL